MNARVYVRTHAHARMRAPSQHTAHARTRTRTHTRRLLLEATSYAQAEELAQLVLAGAGPSRLLAVLVAVVASCEPASVLALHCLISLAAASPQVCNPRGPAAYPPLAPVLLPACTLAAPQQAVLGGACSACAHPHSPPCTLAPCRTPRRRRT